MIQTKITTGSIIGVSFSEKLASSISPKGRVRITVLEDGISKVVWDDSNIVVEQGRRYLAKLVSLSTFNPKIVTMGFGTGGHLIDDVNTPVPPAFNDTALEAQYFQKSIGNNFSLNPSGIDTTVTFEVTLFEPEANGPGGGAISITEAGLFTSDSLLFARETFVPVIKAQSRRVSFTWSIIF